MDEKEKTTEVTGVTEVMDKIHVALAALGSEVMALSIYMMRGEEEENRDRILSSMVDVSAQNMILQHELGIGNDEFTDAFSERLTELYPRPPKTEDE